MSAKVALKFILFFLFFLILTLKWLVCSRDRSATQSWRNGPIRCTRSLRPRRWRPTCLTWTAFCPISLTPCSPWHKSHVPGPVTDVTVSSQRFQSDFQMWLCTGLKSGIKWLTGFKNKQNGLWAAWWVKLVHFNASFEAENKYFAWNNCPNSLAGPISVCMYFCILYNLIVFKPDRRKYATFSVLFKGLSHLFPTFKRWALHQIWSLSCFFDSTLLIGLTWECTSVPVDGCCLSHRSHVLVAVNNWKSTVMFPIWTLHLIVDLLSKLEIVSKCFSENAGLKLLFIMVTWVNNTVKGTQPQNKETAFEVK